LFKNKFPYISVTDEASDFEFGKQLGFAKSHHKSHQYKSGCGPGLRQLPKIWRFHFNISTLAEASDFDFFGFARAHHTLMKKWVWPWARGDPQNFGSPFIIFLQWLKLATSNLVHSLCLPRPIIKSHPDEKVGVALG